MSWAETVMRLAGQAFVGGLLVIIAAAWIAALNVWGAAPVLTAAMVAGVVTMAIGAFVFISYLIWSAK